MRVVIQRSALTAWLAEGFGARRYLLANTALLLLFSVTCGFAWNLGSMIALVWWCRVVKQTASLSH